MYILAYFVPAKLKLLKSYTSCISLKVDIVRLPNFITPKILTFSCKSAIYLDSKDTKKVS